MVGVLGTRVHLTKEIRRHVPGGDEGTEQASTMAALNCSLYKIPYKTPNQVILGLSYVTIMFVEQAYTT